MLRKIMRIHFRRITLLLPVSTLILEVSDVFLFLGVYGYSISN
jgi:hypothetical protein